MRQLAFWLAKPSSWQAQAKPESYEFGIMGLPSFVSLKLQELLEPF